MAKPRLKFRRLAIWLCLLWLTGITGWAQSPNASVQQLLRSGQTALDADDYAGAAHDFERARQIAPENLEANRGLVLSYLQMGRLREAIQLGSDAVARWPRDAELQHWLGLAYFKAGQNAPALAALQRSEAIASGSFDIHFDVALVLLQQSQYAPAADELEKAIKLQPSACPGPRLAGTGLPEYEPHFASHRAVSDCVAHRSHHAARALSSGIRLRQPGTQSGGDRRIPERTASARPTIRSLSISSDIACSKPEN